MVAAAAGATGTAVAWAAAAEAYYLTPSAPPFFILFFIVFTCILLCILNILMKRNWYQNV
jgi:hypothetical protein